MRNNELDMFQNKITNNDIKLKDLPTEILVKLLQIAIEKIDESENRRLNDLGFEVYERDAFDKAFDIECITYDLFQIVRERFVDEKMD